MIKRLLSCAVLTAGLAIAGCGSDTCEDGCGKIYSECKLEVTGLSQGDCVTQCKASESKDEDIKCVMNASCEPSSLEACLL